MRPEQEVKSSDGLKPKQGQPDKTTAGGGDRGRDRGSSGVRTEAGSRRVQGRGQGSEEWGAGAGGDRGAGAGAEAGGGGGARGWGMGAEAGEGARGLGGSRLREPHSLNV